MKAIKNALQASLSVLKKIAPLLSARNASMLLGVLTLFGVVAPETATKFRNYVLVPFAAATHETGDLVSFGE